MQQTGPVPVFPPPVFPPVFPHPEREQYVRDAPDTAYEVAWTVLRRSEDPGRDDGALCVELTRICIDAIGGENYARLVRREWETLLRGIHLNVIEGVVNRSVRKDFVSDLFNSMHSSVMERHRILSLIASARLDDFRQELLEMVSNVGEHDEPSRQVGLARLVESIKRVL